MGLQAFPGDLEGVSNLDWSVLDPRNQAKMAGFYPAFDVHCRVYTRFDELKFSYPTVDVTERPDRMQHLGISDPGRRPGE